MFYRKLYRNAILFLTCFQKINQTLASERDDHIHMTETLAAVTLSQANSTQENRLAMEVKTLICGEEGCVVL